MHFPCCTAISRNTLQQSRDFFETVHICLVLPALLLSIPDMFRAGIKILHNKLTEYGTSNSRPGHFHRGANPRVFLSVFEFSAPKPAGCLCRLTATKPWASPIARSARSTTKMLRGAIGPAATACVLLLKNCRAVSAQRTQSCVVIADIQKGDHDRAFGFQGSTWCPYRPPNPTALTGDRPPIQRWSATRPTPLLQQFTALPPPPQSRHVRALGFSQVTSRWFHTAADGRLLL